MIRRLLKVIVLIVWTSSFSYSQDTLSDKQPAELSIKEAIDKGMLEATIRGSYNPRFFYEVVDMDGVHYGKCMAIILKSNIDTNVHLRLDCGTQLIPTDTSFQTMIVTQKAIFPLYPNEMYTTRFYAMCGQIDDDSPNIETIFRIGELADTPIVKLASYLGENYMQNMLGQHALWALTDQADFEELKKYGADSLSIAMTKELLYNLNIETTLTPKKNDPIEDTNEISINRYYIYVGGGLLVIMLTTILIMIIRYNKNGDKIG